MPRGPALGPHVFQLYSLGDLRWPQNLKAHPYAHFPQSIPLAMAIQLGITTW